MSRVIKRVVMVGADLALIPFALWGAFALRLGEFFPPEMGSFWWLFLLLPLLTVPVFAALGFYRMVVRYMGPHAVYALFKGVTYSALMLSVIVLMLGSQGFPRSILVSYWLILLLGVGGSRFWCAPGYNRVSAFGREKPVVIYGAGSSGAQLAAALAAGWEFHPVAMLDDDRSLHGSFVSGVKVYGPDKLADLIAEYDAEFVMLAMPGAPRMRRKAILQRLESFPVHVKTVPSMEDLVSGEAKPDEVRDVEVEDLLWRDPVVPDPELMSACIAGKNVLVTGAGGSIGSELCRQIIRERPQRLVLLELSEFGLYRIERELIGIIDKLDYDVELIPLLGSVTDRDRMLRIMQAYDIQTVYHAAAYKHVPIVEHNSIEGLRNNALGTWYTAEAARTTGVEHFVLISTDKAVRPTNVMGATKRLAEMVLQSMMDDPGKTTFCMVRFGNVLGSSGSVVPLFREQIKRGGPVTVTHPEITRYFMTIPEAASLVIQAGSMKKGGDVFVLDMGDSVRIVDLARKMIHLMGYEVRDDKHPHGDIEIRFTGLRPGEKLYEELLIGDNVSGTAHPKIFRAEEWAPSWEQMSALLLELETAAKNCDVATVQRILEEMVHGFSPQGALPDLVWARSQGQTAVGNAAAVVANNVAQFQPRARDLDKSTR
ncbi:nucleoside-diphosphate sugar epimerase/dehydratase [Alkalilimnicola ehrlichii]|uniref:polysaccharide biosynthesis protein n=1 Tax=Alkalilimnicola ehrlichii TaxID=351052 RepID=UPI000E2F7513|nr:nucleoside-diphosphate sugar epimerase/dehydratase [Alkalilimnicola ehrlichii]